MGNSAGGIDVNNLGIDDANYNFGNYGNDNPYDENPFPMEQFRTSQLSGMLNQPSQNTIPGVMNEIGSGVDQNPAFKHYLDLAAQGPPKQADYQPGFWSRLGMGLVGGAQALYDPKGAIGTVEGLVNEKYNLAAGQYNKDLSVAGDAAKQEGSLMNTGTSIFRDIASQENYQSLAQNRAGNLGLGYDRLSQNQDLGQQRIDIQARIAKANEDYKNGAISISKRNSDIAAMRLQLAQAESGSLINERNSQTDLNNARTAWGPISGNRSTGPTGGLGKPNAAVMNTELKSAIYSNSILTNPAKGFFLSDGSPNVPRILQDPEARVEWQRIMLHYGMVEQPPPFDMNNLFNVQGQP
jgi:hypothetical protein